jgi:hypothetical protein
MSALTHAPCNAVMSVDALKIGDRVGVRCRAGLVHGVVEDIKSDLVLVSNGSGMTALCHFSRVVLLP